MDPYEYLLSKLNVMLEFTPNCMAYFLYIKLEASENLISDNIPIGWTKKDIFRYYRNLDPNRSYRQYVKEIDQFSRLLNCFPNDLESTEHVDLLLAVNGLNKGA